MTKARKQMVDDMIKIYGFEHEVVIGFAELCEYLPNTEEENNLLKMILTAHQEFPVIEEE